MQRVALWWSRFWGTDWRLPGKDRPHLLEARSCASTAQSRLGLTELNLVEFDTTNSLRCFCGWHYREAHVLGVGCGALSSNCRRQACHNSVTAGAWIGPLCSGHPSGLIYPSSNRLTKIVFWPPTPGRKCRHSQAPHAVAFWRGRSSVGGAPRSKCDR